MGLWEIDFDLLTWKNSGKIKVEKNVVFVPHCEKVARGKNMEHCMFRYDLNEMVSI